MSAQPGPARPSQSFKLDQRGLARVFGELEAAVMGVIWGLGEASVAEVCQRLSAGANYKTVMTVMNRLVTKRVLRRQRASRAFIYRPVETRAAFEQRLSRQVAEGLVLDFGDLAVAQFVDALSAVDPALLAAFEQRLRERVAADSPGGAEEAPSVDEASKRPGSTAAQPESSTARPGSSAAQAQTGGPR